MGLVDGGDGGGYFDGTMGFDRSWLRVHGRRAW